MTGVYIFKIIDIFAPSPLIQKSIFFPRYSKNFLFPPFFQPLTPYIHVFQNKSSYLFPSLPKTKWKIYNPAYWTNNKIWRKYYPYLWPQNWRILKEQPISCHFSVPYSSQTASKNFLFKVAGRSIDRGNTLNFKFSGVT